MVALQRPLNALVVDDDATVLETVGYVLDTWGFEVARAGSQEEALSVARSQLVHFTILDLHVRAVDGFEILTALRSLVAGLPAILISGDLTPDAVSRALNLGAHGCLEKPLDLGTLRCAVRSLIEMERL